MAPIHLPSSSPHIITLSICNRTGTAYTVYSNQVASEKSQYLTQLPRTVQHVVFNSLLCQSDGRISVSLLEHEKGMQVLHKATLLLSRHPDSQVSSDDEENMPLSSKWTSSSASKNGLRICVRQYSPSSIHMMILGSHDPATFLSLLPDTTAITSICLPGTHESLALFGWPISTCQSPESSIEKQLSDGIRYLDIRLAPKGQPGKERLLAYHGITDERIEFGKVLQECYTFLDGVGKGGE